MSHGLDEYVKLALEKKESFVPLCNTFYKKSY